MDNHSGFKNCPACGTMLQLPDEYLSAMSNMRNETEKFREVAVKDFIENDLKPVLFALAKSHSKLAQAEYNRNPSYNNEHFSHVAEGGLIKFLKDIGLFNAFMEEVRNSGSVLLPIDSEHNAIYQSMPGNFSDGLTETGVRKILLTASGGPFRTRDISTLESVTPEEAVAHPNWSMGQKISVDSATMMNKGLEVIEARWLFNPRNDQIEVVIHPQSIIHSMVQYVDGSVLAQMGNPDMRTPIAHALACPERIESGVADLDLFDIAQLDFEKPDLNRFPCLGLAFKALEMGGTAPAILNAANEIAVSAFLNHQIAFTKIASIIEKTLNKIELVEADSLEVVFQADEQARQVAREIVGA